MKCIKYKYVLTKIKKNRKKNKQFLQDSAFTAHKDIQRAFTPPRMQVVSGSDRIGSYRLFAPYYIHLCSSECFRSKKEDCVVPKPAALTRSQPFEFYKKIRKNLKICDMWPPTSTNLAAKRCKAVTAVWVVLGNIWNTIKLGDTWSTNLHWPPQADGGTESLDPCNLTWWTAKSPRTDQEHSRVTSQHRLGQKRHEVIVAFSNVSSFCIRVQFHCVYLQGHPNDPPVGIGKDAVSSVRIGQWLHCNLL